MILGNLIHKVLQAFHEDLESYKDQKILVELLEQKWDADSFVIKNQETQFKKDAYNPSFYYKTHE